MSEAETEKIGSAFGVLNPEQASRKEEAWSMENWNPLKISGAAMMKSHSFPEETSLHSYETSRGNGDALSPPG